MICPSGVLREFLSHDDDQFLNSARGFPVREANSIVRLLSSGSDWNRLCQSCHGRRLSHLRREKVGARARESFSSRSRHPELYPILSRLPVVAIGRQSRRKEKGVDARVLRKRERRKRGKRDRCIEISHLGIRFHLCSLRECRFASRTIARLLVYTYISKYKYKV